MTLLHVSSSVAPPTAVEAFIARWEDAGGAERANYTMFLAELCDLIGTARPDPAVGGLGAYRFERSVSGEADGGGRKRMDLYKCGAFILEAKQGASPPRQATLFGGEDQHRASVRRSKGWAQAMLEAKGQAERYSRGLAREREREAPRLS